MLCYKQQVFYLTENLQDSLLVLIKPLLGNLTFSVRLLNAVFMLRVWNFLRDGPLNRCAFDNKRL